MPTLGPAYSGPLIGPKRFLFGRLVDGKMTSQCRCLLRNISQRLLSDSMRCRPGDFTVIGTLPDEVLLSMTLEGGPLHLRRPTSGMARQHRGRVMTGTLTHFLI
jgi:hypothetical protein